MNNITWLAGAPGRSDIRLVTIRIGLESELKGFRLTSKVRPCFSLVKEYGLTWKRDADKIHVYEALCAGTAQHAKRFDRDVDGKVYEVPEGPRTVDRPVTKVSRARKKMEQAAV